MSEFNENPHDIPSKPSLKPALNTAYSVNSKRSDLEIYPESCLWEREIGYESVPDWDEVQSNLNVNNSDDVKKSILYKYDSPGRNLLHWALFHEAKADLIKQLINIGGEEAVQATSSSGWTPFHVACEHNASLPIMQHLFDTGGDRILTKFTKVRGSREKTTPFHLACHHASIDVVRLFIERGNKKGDTLFDVYDDRFGTPLHAICRRENPSPDFFQLFFKEKGIVEALTDDLLKEDLDEQIPLEYLYRNLTSVKSILLIHEKYYEFFKTQPEKKMHDIKNTRDIIKVMLRKDAWTQSLNESDQKEYFSSRFLHMILNQIIIRPTYLTLIMADIYMQIIIVVITSSGPSLCKLDEMPCEGGIYRILLIIALGYSVLRALVEQMTTTCNTWVTTPKNWLDLFQIIMLIWTISFVFPLKEDYSSGEMKVMTITSGVVWLSLIYTGAYFVRSVGIFMTALRQITLKLIPFIVTAGIIVLGFSHMFYIIAKYGTHCDSCIPCPNNMDDCNCSESQNVWPCLSNLPDFYAATFRMILKNNVELDIFADWKDEDAIFVKWVSYAYAFLVSILLLTVLIAVVQGVFEEVNDNGKAEFWNNRYDYIVTKQAIVNRLIPNASLEYLSVQHLTKRQDLGSPLTNRFNFLQFNQEIFSKRRNELSLDELQFFKWWFNADHVHIEEHIPSETRIQLHLRRIIFFLQRSAYMDIIFPGIAFERVFLVASRDGEFKSMIRGVFRLFSIFVYLPFMLVVITGSFLLGLVTFGHLWPQGMKKKLLWGRDENDGRRSEKVFKPQLNKLTVEVDNNVAKDEGVEKIADEVERRCAKILKDILEEHIRLTKNIT